MSMIAFPKQPNLSRRNARDLGVSRHVACNDSPCPNYRTIPNSDALQDDSAGANPYVVTDPNIFSAKRLVSHESARLHAVIVVRDITKRSNQAIFSNLDRLG